MAIRFFTIALLLCIYNTIFTQPLNNGVQSLPEIDGEYKNGLEHDWLLQTHKLKSGVFKNEKANEIILSNGLISRSFRLSPNAATTSLKVLSKQEELVRAIKPEAVITVNGFTIDVGGLRGQPNLAFLYPDWTDKLVANPLSFQYTGFKVGQIMPRMEWKQVRHHAPNATWPPKGISLQMDYQLDDISAEGLLALSLKSNLGRQEVYHDDFTQLADTWQIKTSPTHERSSFINEGKPGEIYTPNNTAVYAERPLPQGIGVVETSIDAGTDQSGFWGPGIALVWKDRTIKPGEKYLFPKPGENWKTITENKLADILKKSEKKNLATSLASLA